MLCCVDSVNAIGVTVLEAARKTYLSTPDAPYHDRLQWNAMAIVSGVATPAEAADIYSRILRPGSPAWTVTPDPTRHHAMTASPAGEVRAIFPRSPLRLIALGLHQLVPAFLLHIA